MSSSVIVEFLNFSKPDAPLTSPIVKLAAPAPFVFNRFNRVRNAPVDLINGMLPHI